MSKLAAGLVVLLAMVGCQSGSSHQNEESNRTKQIEETGKAGPGPRVTLADVEQGIRDHIDAQKAQGGGRFDFSNDSLDLSLRLVRVHTEYLSILGPNEYFACVDLATETGDVYDVDFFLTGKPGDMKVTSTELHKRNGKPFYTWEQQKDGTWRTVPVERASNRLMGVVEGEDHFRFTYQVAIPDLQDSAQMWIPLAHSDRFQDIEADLQDIPGVYRTLQAGDNKILHLRLLPEHSGRSVRINYKVVRREKGPYAAPEADTGRYLRSTTGLPVGGRFESIVREVVAAQEAETPLTQARALYDHVIDNMRYAKQGTYGTGDAEYACDSRSGNCTEFHSYFISLARTAGIPARFAIGAAIPAARDEGGVNGYHCWAEFYADDQWWPVDISEANKYSALSTYYFGHHPANRIELSRGRDIAPQPQPQSGPIGFFAYPVLEVGGRKIKTETTFRFERAG